MRDFYTTYTLLSQLLEFFFKLFQAQKTHHLVMLHVQIVDCVSPPRSDYQISKPSGQPHG
jgi:hypothetical protein